MDIAGSLCFLPRSEFATEFTRRLVKSECIIFDVQSTEEPENYRETMTRNVLLI